jgi:hypothetical protein
MAKTTEMIYFSPSFTLSFFLSYLPSLSLSRWIAMTLVCVIMHGRERERYFARIFSLPPHTLSRHSQGWLVIWLPWLAAEKEICHFSCETAAATTTTTHKAN